MHRPNSLSSACAVDPDHLVAPGSDKIIARPGPAGTWHAAAQRTEGTRPDTFIILMRRCSRYRGTELRGGRKPVNLAGKICHLVPSCDPTRASAVAMAAIVIGHDPATAAWRGAHVISSHAGARVRSGLRGSAGPRGC